ncbi:DUF4270 family protein [Zhouia sp. PK063]|uniref:DUF4270 family protein n=1 Tax=Zhouia sp. PK063 TaxID=3373602 RepID=UPI0037A1D93C
MKYKIGFILLLIITLASCTSSYDSDFETGDNSTDSNIKVFKIDTLTLKTSTVKFDSLPQTSITRILVGQYKDSIFGTVKSSSVFQLIPSTYTIDSDAIYDSIAVVLHYDKYYYNDTLQYNTINVHRLTAAVTPDDGSSFYNTTKIPYSNAVLGSVTYKPRPLTTGDSVEVKLNDAFGEEIFNQLQEKNITTEDQFKEQFRGITLKPGDSDDGSVIGFLTSATAAYVRIYYRTNTTGISEEGHLDLTMNEAVSPKPFFNQISAENSTNAISNITSQKNDVSSTLTQHKTYIQSGVGVVSKVMFPTVKTLLDIQGQGTLLGAKLKLYPTRNYYSDNLPLRDTLQIYKVNVNNEITSQLAISTTSGTSTGVVALLNKDEAEFNNVYYEVSLDDYIDGLIAATTENNGGLIFVPSDFYTSVNRLVLNGPDLSKYQAILEVTYAIYDENQN